MNNRIGTREWEALSAYLDNQLNTRDRARLEAQLKSDAELRRAYEELRRTRIILRSQRRMRAPRNFMLSPAMAGVRRGAAQSALRSNPGPFTVLRLASVLATIFFIFITVGDLVVQNYGPQPTTISSEQQPQPAFGMGGGGGGAPAIAMAPTTAPAEPLVGAQTVNENSASAIAPDNRSSIDVTPMPTQEAMKQPEQPPNFAQPGVNAADQQQNSAAVQQRTARPFGATLVIRLLQGLLILLAVGAGLAAYYVRRTTG